MNQQEWMLRAGVTLAVISFLMFRFILGKLGKRKLPPGPPRWPLIGNIHLLGSLPHHSLQQLSNKYGPLLYMQLGSSPTIVVSSPELAKEVLRTQDLVFSGRPKTVAGDVFSYHRVDMVWSDVTPYWKHLRKIMAVEVLSASRIASYKNVRREEISHTVQQILSESQAGRVVAMNQMLHDMTLNNVTKMTLGKRYFGPLADEDSPEAKGMRDAMPEVFELMGAFTIGDYFPYCRWLDIDGHEKQMNIVWKPADHFLQKVVDEHRAAHKRGDVPEVADFVDLLLSLKGDDALTDDQKKTFLGDVLFGGTETSADQMHWVFAELMRHPEIRKKAQNELMEVVGPNRLVEESDIPNLKYLQAIVKESFRLHPVAPLLLPHASVEATNIGSYYIPKGSLIFVNTYAIQRDPANWERPLEFDPDRFLDSNIDVKGNDYKFLPFGSGRRMCPGINLGSIFGSFALAQLLHTCDWSLPSNMSSEDVDFTERLGISSAMATSLKVIASPRLPHLSRLLEEEQ